MTVNLRDIPPVDPERALRSYQQHIRRMTDEQLAVERARIEAQPGGACRHLVDREHEARLAEQHEADARSWAALLAAMAPARRWGWS